MMNDSTTLLRNVNGINILISCHGNIIDPGVLNSIGQPDRIPVGNNTTFHFYSEPGENFYTCATFNLQQHEVCNYILAHNNHAIGINFSVSTGHIPNFMISAEPNRRNFMSQVVACVQNPDGTYQNLLLLDISAYVQDPDAHSFRFQEATIPFFTLQEILSKISRRVEGLQREAEILGVSNHVNYHCMFCQDGHIPPFWQDARDSARTADNALLQQQAREQGTPLRHRIPSAQADAFFNPRLSVQRERDRFGTAIEQGMTDREYHTPVRPTLMNSPARQSDSQSQSNPPGQGAGSVSSLTQTFTSQLPELPAPPELLRGPRQSVKRLMRTVGASRKRSGKRSRARRAEVLARARHAHLEHFSHSFENLRLNDESEEEKESVEEKEEEKEEEEDYDL